MPGGERPQRPQIESLAFDRPAEAIPFEEREILDRACFDSFGERVLAAAGAHLTRPADPAAVAAGPGGGAADAESGPLPGRGPPSARGAVAAGDAGGAAERGLRRPGVSPLRLPSAGAAAAAAGDLQHRRWPSIAACTACGSRAHPVPDLAAEGPWREAPFWLWTAAAPRGGGCSSRGPGDELELSGPRAAAAGSCAWRRTAQADRAVEQLAEWAARGVRLRPRALLTTHVRPAGAERPVPARHRRRQVRSADRPDRCSASSACSRRRSPTLSATALLFTGPTARLRHELRAERLRLRDLRFHPEQHVPPGAASRAAAGRETPLAAARRCRADSAASGTRRWSGSIRHCSRWWRSSWPRAARQKPRWRMNSATPRCWPRASFRSACSRNPDCGHSYWHFPTEPLHCCEI